MNYTVQYITILFVTSVIKVTLCSAAMKLYGGDQRVAGVTDVMFVRSLLECSWIFKSKKNSLSYNFKQGDNICELSNNYPEGSAAAEIGWKVYAPIVDGVWTAWNSGSCTVTCGGGTVRRTRTCTNPAPSNGGAPCSGSSTINEVCNGQSCPAIDGAWTEWTSGSCTVACGGGTLTKTRTCTNPAPSNGGTLCSGDSAINEVCNSHSCTTADGAWTEWTSGSCTVDCGGGTLTKTRTCTNPAPSNGGAPCSGDSTINEVCNEHSCITSIGGGYSSSSSQVTWAEAKAMCESNGERLVIINDQAEQDFLKNGISGGLSHWIGMTCNSGLDCTWIDGSRADDGFTSWYAGEPNGANCVWIGHYGSYWDDANCGGRHGFICE